MTAPIWGEFVWGDFIWGGPADPSDRDFALTVLDLLESPMGRPTRLDGLASPIGVPTILELIPA